MAKVILLEDNLKTAKDFAEQLNKWGKNHEKGTVVAQILFYDDIISADDVEKKPEVQDLKKLGIEVKWVNIINFNHVMDQLYQKEENLFIFDTYLRTDKSSAFRYRINVSYAVNKKEDKRIWFYTTAGQEIKDNIVNLFGNMVMEIKYENGKSSLLFAENKEFSKCF